ELVNVILDLRWVEDASGNRVLCRTADYRSPDGSGARQDVYVFGSLPAKVNVKYGPGAKATPVEFDSEVPDFGEIEDYLRYRHQTYEQQATGKGLPVTVNFDNNVPTQMVILLLDICTRVGIEDFTLNAAEAPY
ncbi:MAG: hypothetical protein JXA90_09550, partial [Planctomycetes bacterium]|nr:hypothetical protein [Planctomycetota bacterium]